MKKIISGCCLVLAGLSAQAQSDAQIESLMTRGAPDCFDISYNSSYLIPQLYRAGKRDTLEALVQYAIRECGDRMLFHFQLLDAIGTGRFTSQAFVSEQTFQHLENYKWHLRKATVPDDTSNRSPYVAYHKTDRRRATDSFYLFLQQMASSLKEKAGLSSTEKFLADYYAAPSDTLLTRAGDSVMNGTALYEGYKAMRRMRDIAERRGTTFSIASGIWIPNGKLNVLGPHPYINAHIGMRSPELQLGLTAGIRFMSTPGTYKVIKDDSLYTTRSFIAYYLGLDFNYALYGHKRHSLELVGGMGLDGMNPRLADKGSGTDQSKAVYQDLHSFNINAGPGYKFWTRSWYLGVELKYHALFYNNRGGTDLSGHAITLGLVLGGVLTPYCRTGEPYWY
ncbi:hypothetical protein [Taibaiella koreensis]|uniref:hypothetical protein n=1 Tax=Taibaiella koreensis TaxID=1268548 RepID=UPI000E59E427|nr:hypothetical protein [Taibaiella koreensis]